MWAPLVAALCLVGQGLAVSLPKNFAPRPRQAPSPTDSAPPAQSTICGDIINDVNVNGSILFAAVDVYSCFLSVPFHPAVATNFIKYFNETIQFHSNLAYLKDPPEGYQQPAVDVFAALDVIQKHVDEGFYPNQYAFEADFQLLIQSMHDDHVVVVAGLLSSFSFASPYSITAASVDGKDAPKVYLTDDIADSQAEGWQPSPIKTINGQDAIEYLTNYAQLNSIGTIEPHADWNALMRSPPLDIQGWLTPFDGSGLFYPGDDLTFVLENGTEVPSLWIAIYNDQPNITGPLTTGGDMYNFFVLGLEPASFVEANITDDATDGNDTTIVDSPPEQTSWFNTSSAYPEVADIFQDDLSIAGGGAVTGYFLKDISTGVLSIPGFDAQGDSIPDFSEAVGSFVGNATEQKISKVIIDVQRNFGGSVLLALDAFKAFFPDIDPFTGSRRRIHPWANTLGNAWTPFWDSLRDDDADEREFKEQTAAVEWVISDRIDPTTGKNFTSWDEYANGITYNGDKFSKIEVYDLANPVFDAAAFDQFIPLAFMKDAELDPRPWAPDQIAILTDGICSSACALFVEMMTRAGVRTIVAGGRPTSGPMQAAAGSRGALAYSADELDDDISEISDVDDTAAALPQERDPDIITFFLGFNLRDQIRRNEDIPLQFKYEAADCRIYYTLSNVYNMTRLWRDAATAIFTDNSLCVSGSTGFSTTNNSTPNPPPKLSTSPPILNLPSLEQIAIDADTDDGLQAVKGGATRDTDIVKCGAGDLCPGTTKCRSITVTCSIGTPLTVKACLPLCQNRDGHNGCNGRCMELNIAENKGNAVKGQTLAPQKLLSGRCFPTKGTRALGCPPNPRGGD